MSKQDFLDSLRRSLSGGLDYQEVNGHIQYYSDYIDSRLRQGRSEEEIMAELGEPRLIAKTLLNVGRAGTVTEEYVDEEEASESYGKSININGRVIHIPKWFSTIAGCIIAFLVLTIVFALVTRLLPFALIIMAGIFFYQSIKNLFR